MAKNIPPVMIRKFSLVSVYDDRSETKNPVVLLQVAVRSNLAKLMDTTDQLAFADVVDVKRSRDAESVQLTLEVEVGESNRYYRVRVPFVWLRTAELLMSHSDFPMFVIATEDFEYSATDVYTMTDFGCVVLAPDSDNEDDDDTTADDLDTIISEHITGKPDMGVTIDEFNETRSTVLEIVMSLINGDPRALVSAYGFINPYNKFEADQQKESWKPVAGDKKLAMIKNHLTRLLIATNPAAISSELMQSENQEEHVTDIATFEQMMQENGLAEMFQTGMPVTNTKQKMTPQDQIAYLAKPVTLLPRKMSTLEGKIKDLPSISKPWQTGASDHEMILTGEDLAAAFVVIAARLARLEELEIEDHVRIHPMIVLGHGMTAPGEPMGWVMRETLKLLAQDQALPFNDFLQSEIADAQSPEEMMNSVLVFIMHRFGHQLIEEDWEIDSLRVALQHQPLIATFLEELREQIAAEKNDPHDHSRETPCPVINAIYSLLRLDFNVNDIVLQFGQSLIAIADMNAAKDNLATGEDYRAHSANWTTYVQNYLVNLITEEE